MVIHCTLKICKKLAGISSLKALSLSTLCSPQPLNFKKKKKKNAADWRRVREADAILVSKEN